MLAAQIESLAFRTRRGQVVALDGVELDLPLGQCLGIVGESGSGKSTLALAMAGFVKPGGTLEGSVFLEGQDLTRLNPEALRQTHRDDFGFVFQNPISSLDPTMKIGRQFFDPLTGQLSAETIRARLAEVDLREPERVIGSYPHELSGGMAQRVAIAMMLTGKPRIIIADEPTSALDAEVRLQTMDLLVSAAQRLNASMVIVSHDLRSIRTHCDRVAVMYAGQIVEIGDTSDCLDRPMHPYTAALIAASPGLEKPGDRLSPILGNTPVLSSRTSSCNFAPRCSFATELCHTRRPAPTEIEGRIVSCMRASEINHV